MQQERDWSLWAPPAPFALADVGTMKPNEVWAWWDGSTAHGDVPDVIVFRTPPDWASFRGERSRVDVLWRPCYPDSRPYMNDGSHRVRVQGADEDEPTPPEKLYRELYKSLVPKKQAPARHDRPQKPGEVWASRLDHDSEYVYRVNSIRDDRMYVTMLYTNYSSKVKTIDLDSSVGKYSVLISTATHEQTKSKEVTMAEENTDWSKYVPASRSAIDGARVVRAKLKKGDVYMYADSPAARGVWQCTEDEDTTGKLLAHVSSECKLGAEWNIRDYENCVFLRNVAIPGEPQVNWSDYIPDEEINLDPVASSELEAGDVYVYWYDDAKQGVWMCTTDGSASGRLLAHSTEGPRQTWAIPAIFQDGQARLIKKVGGWMHGYGPQASKRPAPPARRPGKKQVSVDGKLYIDYDSMADSDAFETYPWHRILMPDGTIKDDERPVAMAPVKLQAVCAMTGCSNTGPFGRDGECFSCHVKEEQRISRKMEDDARPVTRVASPMAALKTSHSKLWGGVFNIGA